MKVVDLVTQHPGGWEDILENIKLRWPDLTVDVSQVLWGRTNRVLDRKGEEKLTVTFRPERKGEDRRKFVLYEYLENVEQDCSGMLATEAVRCLRNAGLPVPGDKQWKKPAADWERKNAGNK
jgi:hypothetical protein